MQIRIFPVPRDADTVSQQSLHASETSFDINMFYIIFYIIQFHRKKRLSHQVRYQNQNLVYELDKYLKMVLTSLMNCDSILA